MLPLWVQPIHVKKTEVNVNVATTNATTKMIIEMSIQIRIKRSISYKRVIDVTSPAIDLLFNSCEKFLYLEMYSCLNLKFVKFTNLNCFYKIYIYILEKSLNLFRIISRLENNNSLDNKYGKFLTKCHLKISH